MQNHELFFFHNSHGRLNFTKKFAIIEWNIYPNMNVVSVNFHYFRWDIIPISISVCRVHRQLESGEPEKDC